MKQYSLYLKLVMMAVLCCCFGVAFLFISSLVSERQRNAQLVINTIAHDNVGEQTVMGPYIVVPSTNKKIANMVITPQTVDWQQVLAVDNSEHKVGIYKSINYRNQLNLSGQFSINASANNGFDWGNAKVYFHLADMRGIEKQPVLTLNNGTPLTMQDFNGANVGGVVSNGERELSTMTAPISLASAAQGSSQQVNFKLSAVFSGMQALKVIPIGHSSTVQVTANWHHPKYFGGALPSKKSATNGLSATWNNVYLSHTNSALLKRCIGHNDSSACYKLGSTEAQYGLELIEAVDAYRMTARSIKYALLFLVITFGSFFLFETLKDLRIHPIQYTLVGTALAVFYLLLLSFSEHTGFYVAYLISSVACVSLIVFYVSAVLHGFMRALGLGVLLSAMYAVMFVLLKSEDYTLMLGSVFVFGLLTVVMMLTRNIDWYKVASRQSASVQPHNRQRASVHPAINPNDANVGG